jgi:streptogramin lyase
VLSRCGENVFFEHPSCSQPAKQRGRVLRAPRGGGPATVVAGADGERTLQHEGVCVASLPATATGETAFCSGST